MRFLGTLVATVMLAGCATAYGPIGPTGGYYQQRIGQNAYIVGFRGNGFTSFNKAYDFGTLRAVEIGEELKYEYFAIEGRSDKSKTEIVNTGSQSYTTGSVYGYGSSAMYSSSTTTYSNQMPVSKPASELHVVYFEAMPQGRYLELYEISTTGHELRAKLACDSLDL